MKESQDPYKDIVISFFKKLLDRQPDTIALDFYSTSLRENRITPEYLIIEIQNSQEYKSKNKFLEVDFNNQFKGKVVFLQTIYYNEFMNCLLNIENFRVFGGNLYFVVVHDNTLTSSMLRSLQDITNVTTVYSEWTDDIPKQKNAALQKAKDLQAEWIIFSDPDEHFNKDFLLNFRCIIQSGRKSGL